MPRGRCIFHRHNIIFADVSKIENGITIKLLQLRGFQISNPQHKKTQYNWSAVPPNFQHNTDTDRDHFTSKLFLGNILYKIDQVDNCKNSFYVAMFLSINVRLVISSLINAQNVVLICLIQVQAGRNSKIIQNQTVKVEFIEFYQKNALLFTEVH